MSHFQQIRHSNKSINRSSSWLLSFSTTRILKFQPNVYRINLYVLPSFRLIPPVFVSPSFSLSWELAKNHCGIESIAIYFPFIYFLHTYICSLIYSSHRNVQYMPVPIDAMVWKTPFKQYTHFFGVATRQQLELVHMTHFNINRMGKHTTSDHWNRSVGLLFFFRLTGTRPLMVIMKTLKAEKSIWNSTKEQLIKIVWKLKVKMNCIMNIPYRKSIGTTEVNVKNNTKSNCFGYLMWQKLKETMQLQLNNSNRMRDEREKNAHTHTESSQLYKDQARSSEVEPKMREKKLSPEL